MYVQPKLSSGAANALKVSICNLELFIILKYLNQMLALWRQLGWLGDDDDDDEEEDEIICTMTTYNNI